ncbi:MAG: helix-turn-helix domain-containing protein [Bacteroidales bacterium]
MKDTITFGKFIRQLRENKDIPLRKVAAELDIDPSTLGKIERDKRNPNQMVIERLSRVFSVGQKELIIHFLSDRISRDLHKLEYSSEILTTARKKINSLKKQ